MIDIGENERAEVELGIPTRIASDAMPLLVHLICLHFILMGLASCTFSTKVPTQHIVMFDSDGSPVDPTGNFFEARHSTLASYPHMSEADYEQYLETLFSNVKNSPAKDGTRKILLFFHGGLNSQVASLERVIEPVEENVPLYAPQSKQSDAN